jgi:hypothetical protein
VTGAGKSTIPPGRSDASPMCRNVIEKFVAVAERARQAFVAGNRGAGS